jgi:hypothetical protein
MFCSLAITNPGIAAPEHEFLPAIYSLLLGGEQPEEEINPITPRDEIFRPLAKKRFLPFTRQMEYVQIGSGYKGDISNNLYVIDPLKYNFDPDNPGVPIVEPPDADDLLTEQQVVNFISTDKKTAASGMCAADLFGLRRLWTIRTAR